MSVMPTISSVLLIIYAISASVTIASPTLDHKPISARGSTLIRAGLNITLFNDTNCGHDHIFQTVDHNLTYGVMLPNSFTIQSYILSRYLSSEERLDFSAPYPPGTMPPGGHIPEECGTFLETTSPDSNNNTLHDGTCYLMTGGATCVNVWSTEWLLPIYNTATGYYSPQSCTEIERTKLNCPGP